MYKIKTPFFLNPKNQDSSRVLRNPELVKEFRGY
ncbi:hypothetical protein OROGR_004819 [Orobanche gracilis]